MTLAETIPAPAGPYVVKACSCGRRYDPIAWAQLPNRRLWNLEGQWLELADCLSCLSTMSQEVE